MELIDQIRLHKELSKKIEALEEQKRLLGQSILAQMPSKTLQAPGFVVRHCSRICVKVPLERARLLNATKLEELVDTDKIKNLYQSGQAIDGVSEIHYIQVLEKL